jgi:Ras-related protein Rab-5C
MNSYKVILIGKTCVGKSSIINRYIYDKFNPYTSATIGASYFTKNIVMDDYKFKLNLWDCSGLERFNSLLPMYYRGANIAILVYDVTNLASFNQCQQMINHVKNDVDDIKIILVGNKCDMVREISHEDGLLLANSNNLSYCECSALKGTGIVELFDMVVSKLNIKAESIRDMPIRLEAEEPKKCCY